MKLAVLTATSTAVLIASVSTATLADQLEQSEHPSDNSLSLKLRNYYQDRQLKDFKQSYYIETLPDGTQRKVKNHDKQQAWGQGLEVNFESAYLGSPEAGIGFDFSLYGGLKLLGDKDRYGTTILKQDTPEYDPAKREYLADQSSYGKVGLANIKGFAGDNHTNIHAHAGWISIEKPLLKTYHRLTPTNFQGAKADAKLGDFDLYGAWTNKVSLYNHDKMEEFTSNKPGKDGRYKNRTKIDYIYTVGGSYDHESGFGADLAYAESDSYLKLYHANLNYTFLLAEETSLFLEGQVYHGKENGDKWTSGNTTFGGFDKDANLYNLNAKLTYDMLSLSASYSQIKAEKNDSLGYFDYHLAYESGHDYDDLGYSTKRQLSDFNYNGERVWQAGVQYSFDQLGLPGLTMGYTYTQGSDIEATNMARFRDKYKETEHNVALGYSFQQKELKGLSVTLLYAQHKGDKELSEIKNQDKDGYEYEGMTDLRLYVDYTVSVF
ncbi:OprD family outer membrane porin [Endozoicomonas arenosclerae]|uniref:OprD family outer membrane porin n=1 Tax=Endozoicomonas arenosclerae TaxID=1633495 RepID=UPI000785083B|nr:OprD family outer membrane porin [Endozoicomonas arenosclerae]